jgi:UDP-N-acetyl-alpha-D-muramoyl-L-alanyl-L-glutamate epimerase
MIRQNNFQKFIQLRKDFQTFSYLDFEYSINENLVSIQFRFAIDNEFEFRPQTTCKINSCIGIQNREFIEHIIFHIGMVELISYWKTTCAKRVEVHPFLLTHKQIAFWKKVFFNGLGEFFYLNSIETDMHEFMTIVSMSDRTAQTAPLVSMTDAVIVPVGGGKDSVVSVEFFKAMKLDVLPMLVNPRKAMTDTVANAGFCSEKSIVFNRSIDPLLLKLNERGFLNGHTPFSALLAFQSLLASVLTGVSQIALSNESSANEPTVQGTNINHQYSKSLEFENDYRSYVAEFLTPDHNYFSILRPLSELQIAYVFCKYSQHFHSFRSCNAGSKTNSWCGRCPKCLFTAIILAPFIHKNNLNEIFGCEIFENQQLQHTLDELTGVEQVKPFECVGTTEEVNMALSYVIDHVWEKPLPFLLQHFTMQGKHNPISKDQFFNTIHNQFNENHHVTPQLYEQLKSFIKAV